MGRSAARKGIATPQKEIELVKQRLAAAEPDYKERQNWDEEKQNSSHTG